MKIKETTISKYLQYAHTNLHSDYTPNVDKVKRTREKLYNVIQRDVKEHDGVLLTLFRREPDFLTHKERIESIMNAIGVYNVPDIMDGRSYLWHKITGNDIFPTHGDYWPSYLGNKEICSYGGRVVVVLSDEGVKWLNEIVDKVKAYIPVETE